jgi:hypothetical protein
MVSGDGDSIRGEAGLGVVSARRWLTTTTYLNVNFFPIIMFMTTSSTDDAFSSTMKSVSKGVVVT